MTSQWIEILGTGASVVVALSLMMKNLKSLRIINTLGALVFAVYGLLIASWPVFGLNLFITATNLFYLWKMGRAHESFRLLKVDSLTDGHLQEFFAHWLKDIQHFNPDFQPERLDSQSKIWFVLRETLPIVLFVCQKNSLGFWEIGLDYAIPTYRDRKNGQFLYSEGWKNLDLDHQTFLTSQTTNPAQAAYLQAVGFKRIGPTEFRIDFSAQ